METEEEREARLDRLKGAFGTGSLKYDSNLYDAEVEATSWVSFDPHEALKSGKSYSASDMERKWHVEPRFITLKKYLKKDTLGDTKLAKEVYRSAYNQGVTIRNKDGEKTYPKAWLEMFFGNLDELANFLKD